MIGLIMFPGQERTPRRDISLSLGSHIGRDTELPKALLPCSLVGVFLLEDLEICTCLHIQPTHTYTRGHIHMSADVFRFARVHTYVYILFILLIHLSLCIITRGFPRSTLRAVRSRKASLPIRHGAHPLPVARRLVVMTFFLT